MSGLRLSKRGGVFYATGTVGGQRIRKSLGTGDRGVAEELRAQYEARLWKRHTYGDEAVRTFEEAALSYLEQGGEGRFLPRILAHFKGRAIGAIKPAEIKGAALALYPDAGPATRNRQVITPTVAVINHAHDLGWCGAIRVKGFPVPKSRKHKPTDRTWLRAFMAQADADGLPHLATIVLYMHQTGARIGEAIALTGDDCDLSRRIVLVPKTKTDEGFVRHLTAELVLRIGALAPASDKPLFHYAQRSGVNGGMQRVCERAGIEYHPPHAAGRHSFATNAMQRPGARVKQVMEAGGWKSAGLFLGTYVHEADAGAEIARQQDEETGPIGTDTTQAAKPGRYRPWNKGLKR
ncbi:tyrosine-type recombinase/integrase [uncultured Jannaschia sp.]|uniref:tyrosine-type recombinase/integrase n=1 Tax=uncultured Jannaschia sp. TaxID=293347 RepID=UPI002628840F|nr:tyrosine-type recombinase/integrase [uncultured Jannaschia sp.]